MVKELLGTFGPGVLTFFVVGYFALGRVRRRWAAIALAVVSGLAATELTLILQSHPCGLPYPF
jgi:hypothetical protein